MTSWSGPCLFFVSHLHCQHLQCTQHIVGALYLLSEVFHGCKCHHLQLPDWISSNIQLPTGFLIFMSRKYHKSVKYFLWLFQLKYDISISNKWHNFLKDHTSSQVEFYWWEVTSQECLTGGLLKNEFPRGENIVSHGARNPKSHHLSKSFE